MQIRIMVDLAQIITSQPILPLGTRIRLSNKATTQGYHQQIINLRIAKEVG